ncbi:MAG: cytochrome c oxidase accessory protein CcoG [Gammaproteobacteria bacterium]|nr:cytochrome c oxidase accessory protein CcoG [Gammaproteobacteria bacterium]NIR83517.1 cytochrome c oxidase accessory protein CcoG [Gammaproteobacteria bacterium]NIR91439.1 cytochrome c oxidase accessory protein CcoG [Gammaproteobacteria bacterium]NIU04679.1 cytochrome c oxidase accessory protein CcoG [Gammaproteobacteria bacterium]NIV51721.1 cytochrome c oxidase accessory protein CcoG [Gammaproteobacteria bacterium]
MASGSVSKEADEVLESLYARRQKVYPREVHGWFAGMRVLAVAVLLGLYYGLAWLSWDGQQLLVFDLPARRFHVFGLTFYPQDFLLLALLLITAALSLFFFTALAGRLWCGYACPQTVWTEIFMWMERKIEGDRPKQMKLDRAPSSSRKLAIKGTKHLVWIAFSFYTGFTFVGYFTPIRELSANLLAFNLGPWETFWVFFYGFATYGNAGWMREQVCIYMCPYARFQSAMFDRDTLVISYDETRGEPRGPRRRGVDHRAKGLGDCIDCTMCVQVCPTGIDIRDGLQYECIACAACVDACDHVMEKMGYPKGLIRYTTENAMEGKPTRILRPRILVYGALLLALVSATAFGITQREPVDIEALRDRNALYRETNDGLIENVYTLKIYNKHRAAHSFTVSVSGIEGLRLVADQQQVQVLPGEVVSFPVRVRADPMNLEHGSNAIRFIVRARDDEDVRSVEDSRFLGPRFPR